MAATISASLPSFPYIIQPKLLKTHHVQTPNDFNPSTLTLSSSRLQVRTRIPHSRSQIWRISVTPEAGESLVQSSGGDSSAPVIQVLLIIAFVSLSLLTIGVIYLGVTDFLQKREGEKIEKEEAAKNKKGGKKRKVRARAGPRGFGQKFDDDDQQV